jgi:hypothetical protein
MGLDEGSEPRWSGRARRSRDARKECDGEETEQLAQVTASGTKTQEQKRARPRLGAPGRMRAHEHVTGVSAAMPRAAGRALRAVPGCPWAPAAGAAGLGRSARTGATGARAPSGPACWDTGLVGREPQRRSAGMGLLAASPARPRSAGGCALERGRAAQGGKGEAMAQSAQRFTGSR